MGARGLSPLDSTAGCGKPHVRWCGRADGRNPVSPTRSRCDLAAYPNAARAEPRALESFKVGCHHRITRRALVEWLARNRNEQRAGE